MKKLVSSCLLLLLTILSSTSFAESLPAGTYQYLFSDGSQSFYYDKDYTIRIDKTKMGYFTKGNFDVTVAGNQYKRLQDQFTFVFPVAGIFETKAGGPIYFTPSNPTHKQMVDFAGAGTTIKTTKGTFKKESNGNVIFTPNVILPALNVKAGDPNFKEFDPSSVNRLPVKAPSEGSTDTLPITDAQ
jgi:hypothetical protein